MPFTVIFSFYIIARSGVIIFHSVEALRYLYNVAFYKSLFFSVRRYHYIDSLMKKKLGVLRTRLCSFTLLIVSSDHWSGGCRIACHCPCCHGNC